MPRRKPNPDPDSPDLKPHYDRMRATYLRQCQACAAWIAKVRREIEAEDIKEQPNG